MFVAQVAKERSKADELFQKVGFGYCPIDSQQMSSLLIYILLWCRRLGLDIAARFPAKVVIADYILLWCRRLGLDIAPRFQAKVVIADYILLWCKRFGLDIAPTPSKCRHC